MVSCGAPRTSTCEEMFPGSRTNFHFAKMSMATKLNPIKVTCTRRLLGYKEEMNESTFGQHYTREGNN